MNHPRRFQGLDKVPVDGFPLGHVHHLREALLCDKGVELVHVLAGQGSVSPDIDLLRLLNPLPGGEDWKVNEIS